MRRVAEIINIVPERREDFIKNALHPDKETERVLWLCGVRKQQYFALNELIFMTFEYEGNHFNEDMQKMAFYLDGKGVLINRRRKDVPLEERATTDWWAPIKRLGTVLEENPFEENAAVYQLMDILDGAMSETDKYSNISYDEDDWSESLHI